MVYSHEASQLERRIREARQSLAEQKALVRSMIVQGTHSQAAEDRIRHLEQTLSRMIEQRQRALGPLDQRKKRDHKFS
jgi:hypothetical protein